MRGDAQRSTGKKHKRIAAEEGHERNHDIQEVANGGRRSGRENFRSFGEDGKTVAESRGEHPPLRIRRSPSSSRINTTRTGSHRGKSSWSQQGNHESSKEIPLELIKGNHPEIIKGNHESSKENHQDGKCVRLAVSVPVPVPVVCVCVCVCVCPYLSVSVRLCVGVASPAQCLYIYIYII